MHETGVIRALIDTARAEAERQGGTLRSIQIRLGALAAGSPSHLRDHFEVELQRMGLSAIRLDITEQPAHPAGVEITSIEIAK